MVSKINSKIKVIFIFLMFCWFLAAVECRQNVTLQPELIPAFLTESCPTDTTKSFQLKKVSSQTYRVCCSQSMPQFSEFYSWLIQSHPDLTLIRQHCGADFDDYYFECPSLSETLQSHSKKIHIAFSHTTGQLYIGSPYIDYDF